MSRRVTSSCILALAAAHVLNAALTDQQKKWALATTAIRTSENGERHDILGGVERTEDAKRLLDEAWGVKNRTGLLAVLKSLEARGHRAGFEEMGESLAELSPEERKKVEESPRGRVWAANYRKLGKKSLIGWDYSRYIALCRWGYRAEYFTEDEAWRYIMPAARLLQTTFRSWQELGRNYLTGREYWSSDDEAAARHDYAYRKLVLRPDSPWRQIPWGLDLTEGGGAAPAESADSSASLYMIARPGGLTCFWATVLDRRPTPALADGIRNVIGCPGTKFLTDKYDGRDWSVTGECVRPEFAKGAEIRAEFQLEPFAAALKEQRVTELFVQIAHSMAGSSNLTPPARYFWIRDGEKNDALTLDLGEPAPSYMLQYGYSPAQQNQFYLSAGISGSGALLLAFAILWFSSRKDVSPQTGWSSFWRAQIVIPCVAWAIWLLLIVGQDGLSIVRLASGREGLAGALTAIARLCLLFMALQVVSSMVMSPGYRWLRGARASAPQSLRVAFWRSAVPAPMAALFLLATDPQLVASSFVLTFSILLCLVLQLICVYNLVRAFRVGGPAVSEGELRDRVFAIAAKAKVRLRRLCVIPEGPWRSVHALTTGDGCLLLSERILSSLSRPEVDAIVAHELAHLRSRHRPQAIALGIFTSVGLLAVTVLRRPEGSSPVLHLLVLMGGLVVGIAAMNAFRRRNDYIADRMAVELIGNAEPLITAILNLERLRGFPIYSSLPEELFFGRASVLGRVRAIARRGGVTSERLAELIAAKGMEPPEKYPPPALAPARVSYVV